MNEPVLFAFDGFQDAWVAVAKHLARHRWESYSVVVHVRDPLRLDRARHSAVERFAATAGLLGPKHVAYTIFPHKLYATHGTAEGVFDEYNRPRGLYDRTRSLPKHGWGTYFRRMTQYEGKRRPQNQLGNIITAIRSRRTLSRAAYTIVIQYPGTETIRKMGSPCLNFMTVQIDSGPPPAVGLLAVYRNHDFLERAYGNYWGLCNLIAFLARETRLAPGPLTCVSSHAYVPGKKASLSRFLGTL